MTKKTLRFLEFSSSKSDIHDIKKIIRQIFRGPYKKEALFFKFIVDSVIKTIINSMFTYVLRVIIYSIFEKKNSSLIHP